MPNPVPPAWMSFEEKLAFNKRLAGPRDQIPEPPAATYVGPGNTDRGWETGNPSDILAKYGGDAMGRATYAGFPVTPSMPGSPGSFARPFTMPNPVGATGDARGATGDLGSAGMEDSTTPSPALTDPSTMAKMPSAPPAPAQNALQRQQAEAEQTSSGLPPMSPQRRYFWSTGLIDARATQSPRNRLTNWDETFGAGATHMGSAPQTWEQRQQINRRKIQQVTQQRGLDDWTPY